MSFSDMMSSARGPGVIGMLLALVVLVGFGVLFMFAFDEGFQGGGPTIESEIASQARDIENYTIGVAAGREKLALAPARDAQARDLRKVKRETQLLVEKSAELKTNIESAQEDIAATKEEWASYKDEYREFIRGKSKGEELETLETRGGDIFRKVNVREVTAIGIQIRHAEGFKRIPFEELSDEMQDLYQFDPAQKQDALAAEAGVRARHNAAAAVAGEISEQKMAEQRAKDDAESKAKILSSIQEKEAQILAATSDIQSLEQDKIQAQADANAARAAGKMHLSKSGSINSRIRSKQNRISTLRSEIGRLKSQL